MANLTITIDDEVLKRARIRALRQGTSVNALLRNYLMAYSGSHTAGRAVEEFIEMARKSKAGSGKRGRTWKRDDIYEG